MAKQLFNEGYKALHLSKAFSISKSSLYRKGPPLTKRRERPENEKIKAKIDEIIMAHPYWGYRRVWAWLKRREGFVVNKKRIYRLMKEMGRLLRKKRAKPKRSYHSKPRATKPKQIWGIDMSKFLTLRQGWANMVIVLDWWSKKIVGIEVAKSAKTEVWLKALDKAIESEFPEGVRGAGLRLVSDNGSQPTSRRFMEVTKTLDIEQIFTSYNNPKGNADTERAIRTIKEEAIWPAEYEGIEEAREALNKFVGEYNSYYPHSGLGYLSPLEVERKYYKIMEENDADYTNSTQKLSTF